jgi:hypothetical protein
MLDNLRDGERCHNTTLIIADFDTDRRRRHSIVDIVPDDIAGTFLGLVRGFLQMSELCTVLVTDHSIHVTQTDEIMRHRNTRHAVTSAKRLDLRPVPARSPSGDLMTNRQASRLFGTPTV